MNSGRTELGSGSKTDSDALRVRLKEDVPWLTEDETEKILDLVTKRAVTNGEPIWTVLELAIFHLKNVQAFLPSSMLSPKP